MWQRETFTERLADVIQVLQLARKTGMLTAERMEVGGKGVHGTIKFLRGQIIHSTCGEYTGEKALSQLMTWRGCRFAFLPSEEQAPSPTSSSGRLPAVRVQEERTEARKTPAYGIPIRIRHIEEVLTLFPRLNLSRIHRQLFLLIDGQRTTIELARLIGKRPEEVEALLLDLERARLIQR